MPVYDKSNVTTKVSVKLSEEPFGAELSEDVDRSYWREGRFLPGEEGVPELFETGGKMVQTNYVHLDWHYRKQWRLDGVSDVYDWEMNQIIIGGAILKKNGEPGERGAIHHYQVWSEEVRAEQPQWVQDLYEKYHPQGKQHPFAIGVVRSGSRDAFMEKVEREHKLAEEVLARPEGGG